MQFLVRFAIAALLPGSATSPSAAELGLAEFVRRFLRETSWTMWFATTGSALAFQLAPIATVGWPVPAAALPARALDRHAARLVDHDVYLLRQAAFMLKMVAALHWAAHPRVREQFGLAAYAPDPRSWRST